MKSLELSVIRTEGLEEDLIECLVYLDSCKYAHVNLKSQINQNQIYLPLTGKLGLKLKSRKENIGELYINLLELEKDGLQWLPIMENGTGEIKNLPDEVPMPRILVSLAESRTKVPDVPLETAKEKYKKSTKNMLEVVTGESFGVENKKPQLEVNMGINVFFKGKRRNTTQEKTTFTDLFEDKPQNHFIIIDLKEQLRQQKNRTDQEVSENREKTACIEKLKISAKENESAHEENVNTLKNTVSKLQKKIYQKKKQIRESDLELKLLKQNLKTTEDSLLINEKTSKEKIFFLENAINDSEKSREELQLALENFKSESSSLVDVKDCEKCLEFRENFEKTTRANEELRQKNVILSEKLVTQEFSNEELLIQIQELKSQIKDRLRSEFDEEIALKNKFLNQLLEQNPTTDDLDEKVEAQFPDFLRKSSKIMRGVYFLNGKKVHITEKGKFLNITCEGKEITYSELLEYNLPKHEKNSFSLEDISAHVDALKPSNLIHNRSNLRENKLRILTKQW